MTYKELKLASFNDVKDILTVGNNELHVRKTLPIRARMAFVEFIAQNAVDDTTGTFSPVRVEIFFSLALARWYADITFEEGDDLLDAYDELEQADVINGIVCIIGQEEFNFMNELVNNTLDDIARYNNSFAGVIQTANTDTTDLNNQLNEIIRGIQGNKEDLLSEINSVVETD